MTPLNLVTEAGDQIITEAGGALIGERAYAPYEGYNLFDLRANWAEDPTERLVRSMTTLENVTGLPLVRSHTTAPVGSFEMLLTLASRDEIREFRSWLAALKGRQVPVWVPTWYADLSPTQDPTGTSVVIESVGYAGRMFPEPARRHLALVDNTGLIYPRGVTAASDNGTTETLTIAPTLGTTLDKAHTLISFLLLCRLQRDNIQIEYFGHSLAEVTLPFVEVPREAPTP